MIADSSHALIRVALTPVRDKAAHDAQRVTDWLLGEVVEVLDEVDGWARTRGPDGSEGWVPGGPLMRVDADGADAWRARATLFSTGVTIARRGRLGRLPWGARVAPADGDGALAPGGRKVAVGQSGRLVDATRPSEPREAVAERMTACAHAWLGVPYVWGGRTELGVDCSGFVQAIMARFGVALPRDSVDQREATEDIDEADPGDLIFFAPEGREISHVAVSLGGARIVHCSAANGCVTEDDLDRSGSLAELLAGSIVARTRPLGEAAP